MLERMDLPLGVVLGTFGVQRHLVRFTGAHAHAGATPMDLRRDAFLAAARSALAWRDDAAARDDVRATTGVVKVSPGIVTAFNGTCEVSLDQRALDADVLAEMLAAAQAASERDRRRGGLRGRVGAGVGDRADPVRRRADRARRRGRPARSPGTSHRLPSGPLHDAAEMARVMPTVMLFVKSLGGVSHTKEEDTPEEDLELSVRALHELTRRTLAWAGGGAVSHARDRRLAAEQRRPRADRARAAHVGRPTTSPRCGSACRSSSPPTRSPPA